MNLHYIDRDNNESGIWNQFESIIFVECKNWSNRVDAKEIRNIEGKIRNYKEGALGQIKLRHQRERFMIIPLNGVDLEEVFRTLDLSTKINEKWIELYQ